MNIQNALLLAPMAELSHAGLRSLIEDFGGCDYYFSEMISVNALLAGSVFEKYYTQTEPDGQKLILQLLGNDAEKIIRASAKLNEIAVAGIDINMGCSAPDIARFGSGIHWMKDIEKARALAGGVRRAVSADRSVSVKIRIGYEEDPDYLIAFARALASEGIDFITLHPRVKNEKLKHSSRWKYITLLKQELRIPVAGNGDVTTWENYDYKRTRFNADAIMIGRKAAGAPWFFAFLRGREHNPALIFEVNLYETALRFHTYLEQYQPSEFLKSRAQRFYQYFSENLFHGYAFFTKVSNAPDYYSIRHELDAYFKRHPEEVMYYEKE